MSEATIQGIHEAIQKHIDSFEGEKEQLVDFVVMTSALNPDGRWAYSYTTSSMISAHGTIGLASMGLDMVTEDCMPQDAP